MNCKNQNSKKNLRSITHLIIATNNIIYKNLGFFIDDYCMQHELIADCVMPKIYVTILKQIIWLEMYSNEKGWKCAMEMSY